MSNSHDDDALKPLTALRFVAASAVLMFHFGAEVPALRWGAALWAVANTAVSFFFFLSGFILAYVYGRRAISDRREFYAARLARIVPLYLLAFGAMVVLRAIREPVAPLDVLLGAFLVQAWVPGHSQTINIPGWSLSVELFFYLLFPWVLALLARRPTTRALSAVLFGAWALNLSAHVVAVVGLGSEHGTALADFVYFHPLVHLATFVSGAAGGMLFRAHRARFAKVGGPLALAALVGLVAIVLLGGEVVQRFHHNGLFVPVFFALIAGTAELRGPVGRVLSSKPMQVLGEASYGIYILQIPVALTYFGVQARLFPALGAEVSFALFFLLLTGSSVAAFHLVEVPARRWLRRVLRRRPS